MSDPRESETTRAIWQHITNLHYLWQSFRALFAKNEEQVVALNRMAPAFFELVQRLLIRDLYAGISALTDPSEMGGRDNLVIDRLLEEPTLTGHTELLDKLRIQISEAHEASERFRTHRNKIIAHFDLSHALGKADPLPTVQFEDVQRVLDAFAGAYNTMLSVDGGNAFFNQITDHGGADAIAELVVKAWKDRRADLKAKMEKYGWTDFPLDEA